MVNIIYQYESVDFSAYWVLLQINWLYERHCTSWTAVNEFGQQPLCLANPRLLNKCYEVIQEHFTSFMHKCSKSVYFSHILYLMRSV